MPTEAESTDRAVPGLRRGTLALCVLRCPAAKAASTSHGVSGISIRNFSEALNAAPAPRHNQSHDRGEGESAEVRSVRACARVTGRDARPVTLSAERTPNLKLDFFWLVSAKT